MSSALLKTPLRQVQSVQHLLMNEGARDQLAMVAAKHMNPERMMRVVANAIRTTPKLQQCEPMSFLGALMQCASLGLEPNTVLGHAYMIPFDNKRKNVTDVQVVIGYKGLIDLARRSGHITSLSANIHYSDDELWEYEEGTEAKLRHRPGPLDGKKLHAYAIAKFKDGGHAYVVLPWAHVIKIRDASQGYQTAKKFGKTAETPWVKHEDEMAKKTAIRALAKYLPLSVEFMDAMQMDEAKADYRAFAVDPAQGLTIEGDAEETSEQDEPEAKRIEQGRTLTSGAAAQTVNREPAGAKKAAPEPKRMAPEPEHSDPGPTEIVDEDTGEVVETETRSNAGPAPDRERFENMAGLIVADIEGGMSRTDMDDLYGPQIAAIATHFPDLDEAIQRAIRAAGI